MTTKRYALTLLLLLPVLLRAQTTDSSRTRRVLQPDPARPAVTPLPRSPLTSQEKAQIMNAVGGGTYPGVMIRTLDNRYEGLRGTPYFLAGWSKGEILMTDGRRYVDVPLKFDAFRQALILLRPKMGNDSIIVDRGTVNRFELIGPEGQSYLFKHYSDVKLPDDMGNGGYFLVLYEGNTALLKRITKTFREANFKQPYSVDVRYDSFENNHGYYVLKPDQTLAKVKLSKKSLLDALDDKNDALKTFANKLSFKSEADAVALMQAYNNL